MRLLDQKQKLHYWFNMPNLHLLATESARVTSDSMQEYAEASRTLKKQQELCNSSHSSEQHVSMACVYSEQSSGFEESSQQTSCSQSEL